MADRKNDKVIKYRRPLTLNIGILIFGVILLYVLISIVSYLTSHKTEVYEVRMGTLNNNSIYSGIALRNEKIVYSDYTGTINYYNKEGERIAIGAVAYSVDENGEITDRLIEAEEESYFTAEDQSAFRSDIISFLKNYNNSNFSALYNFKSESVTSAQKISNQSILDNIEEIESESVHFVTAEDTGEIVYAIDKGEGLTFETLTASSFDQSSYQKTQLQNGDKISAGNAAYKVITDENWSVAIAVDSAEEAEELVREGYIEVMFLKNQETSWAAVSMRSDDEGNYYVNLRFNNSMHEFCTDRFVDIELLSEAEYGLKVPNSSITKGNFFLVPTEYVIKNGSGGQQGVLLEVYTSNNERSTQFVAATPYYEANGYYYLDDSVLKAGQIIDKENSSEQYTLGEQAELIGVYYINRGYPDFRTVTILYQNEEYAIVASNNLNYGLKEYDYIVLNADSVSLNNY